MNISVLCTQSNSIYQQFVNQPVLVDEVPVTLDLYDVKRNAFNFNKSNPIIAHPPCRLWGNFKGMAKSKRPLTEKELGRFCTRLVIRNGGILEQPFDSKLFYEMGLPLGGCQNELGFTLEIPQRWFGHAMIKNTWLFFSKIDISLIPPIYARLSGTPAKSIENLSKRERDRTPVALADWLIRSAYLVDNTVKSVPGKLAIK
jgi:hypothetical protein